MATVLVLKNTTLNGITDSGDGICYDMTIGTGSSDDSAITNTTASGTEIQLTKTAGGSTIAWISGRVPAGGVTLTTLTANIAFLESSMNANCGARIRVFRYQPGPTITELGGGPFNDGVEFTTASAFYSWIANFTDQAFNENDRLLIRLYLTNVGTMGGGFTCTCNFGGSSWTSTATLAETVTFKPEEKTGTISSNLPIPTSAMSGQKIDTGTIAANLLIPTSAMTGQKVETGTLSSNLPVITAVMEGQKVDIGTFDSNLLIPTSNMSGEVTAGSPGETGTINSNLLIPTASFSGIAEHIGTINTNLPIPTTNFSGISEHLGSINTSLPKPTANLSGIAEHIGTLIAILPKPTSAMSGSLGHSGVIGSNLPMIAASLAGSLGHSGIITSNLPIPLSAMIGFVGIPPAGGGDAAVNIGGGIIVGGSNISLGDVL